MARLREADAAHRLAHGGADFVEAFARGLNVIHAFGRERRQLSLSDVARVTDLPKASVRRMLHTLSKLGMVESDGRIFRLTPAVLGLACDYLVSNKISTVVQPACERVSRAAERSCFAAVLTGQDIVVIAHALPRYPMELSPLIGLRLPAFSTAAGRAILGTFAEQELDAWMAALKPVSLTSFTPTDPAEIRKRIVTARERGYGTTEQEVKLGENGLAVPLRRYDGRVVAALHVTNTSEETDPAAHLALLQDAARQLEQQLF